MISEILDYVDSYDAVRAVLGVPAEELPDTVLSLDVYKYKLNLVLTGVTGTYPSGDPAGERDLVAIHEAIDSEDAMYGLIHLFSVYSVADTAANSLPMFAYKTKADGKSTLTRHSAESVYQDTRAAIKDALSGYVDDIRALFDETYTEADLITAVAPAVDIVTEG